MATLLAVQPLNIQVAASAENVEQRVESILARMTLEEKIGLMGGAGAGRGVPGAPRVGVPPMTAADGPFGVRYFSRTTVYPGGIALAATWDTDLIRRVGVQMGHDARARGVHFLLAPGVNIYRAPLAGRNSEYFGEDPYLSSRVAVAFIEGVQTQGVAAVVKHYLGNDSEYARHTTESIIDERTAREIYLPPFEAAVKIADVAAVMDSYSIVNGEHMTQNRHFNVDILKTEWGFKGLLMSDWNATYDTAAAVNSGLDLEMPSAKYFKIGALEPLLRDGKVAAATIDDHVRRLLRIAVRFGWLDRPQFDPAISRYSVAGRAIALEAASSSVVLLKNTNSVLPLDRTKIRSIAVIGPNAYPAILHGGGSVAVVPYHATSLLQGLSGELGDEIELNYCRGIADMHRVASGTRFTTSADGQQHGLQASVFDNIDLTGTPVSMRIDRAIDQGAPLDITPVASGDREFDPSALTPMREMSTRWTGYYTPTHRADYEVVVQIGGNARYRIFVDDNLVSNHWHRKTALAEAMRLHLEDRPHKIVLELGAKVGGFYGSVPFVQFGIVEAGHWVDPAAEQIASRSDAVVVAVGFDPSTEAEDSDRTFSLPPGQDELVRRVCSLNERCVVVVMAGGAVDMSGWLGHSTGVLQAWYLGQEAGTALAKVLFGSVSPSGHLPATFEREWQDNPTHDSYYPQEENRVRYKEGVLVGYRGYEARGVTPQFPFGHGLSYTTFWYDELSIRSSTDPASPDTLYYVSFRVKNTGLQAGAVVPQLYIEPPKSRVTRAPKELKGFTKVLLNPGESRQVELPLDVRSFAFYDAVGKHWLAEFGTYQVLIGDSSQEISLRGQVTLVSSYVIEN